MFAIYREALLTYCLENSRVDFDYTEVVRSAVADLADFLCILFFSFLFFTDQGLEALIRVLKD